jgi:hypothetical protein
MAGFLSADAYAAQNVRRIKKDNPPAANAQKAISIREEIETLQIEIAVAAAPLVIFAVIRPFIDAPTSAIPLLLIAASCAATVFLERRELRVVVFGQDQGFIPLSLFVFLLPFAHAWPTTRS